MGSLQLKGQDYKTGSQSHHSKDDIQAKVLRAHGEGTGLGGEVGLEAA